MSFAPFAWFAWAELLVGFTKTATDKAVNVCKALGGMGLDFLKMLGHESSFPNRSFLDSGRNKYQNIIRHFLILKKITRLAYSMYGTSIFF